MRKEQGLAEECAGAGEEDEDESDGEETAEKSFVWENAAWPHFQCLGHAQSSGDERGEVGEKEQNIVGSKMILSSAVGFVAVESSQHVGHDEGG